MKNVSTNKHQQNFSKGKENSILFSFKPVDNPMRKDNNSHLFKNNHAFKDITNITSVFKQTKCSSKHKNSINQWDQGRYSSVKKL